jgi:hypothetical protein
MAVGQHSVFVNLKRFNVIMSEHFQKYIQYYFFPFLDNSDDKYAAI